MKKNTFLLFIAFICFFSNKNIAQTQRDTRLGIKIGAGTTSVPFSTSWGDYDVRLGYNFGGYFVVPIGERWDLNLNMLMQYSNEKVGVLNVPTVSGTPPSYQYGFKSIRFPIIFAYTNFDKENAPSLSLGLTLGKLLTASRTFKNLDGTKAVNIIDVQKEINEPPFEFMLQFGGGFKIAPKTRLELVTYLGGSRFISGFNPLSSCFGCSVDTYYQQGAYLELSYDLD